MTPMTNIDYNPFGNKGLILKFPCKTCGYWIKTDEIDIPPPDFSSETVHDSYNDSDDYTVCPKCDSEFNITVWASYAGGYIDITELDDDSEVEVEEIPEPYDEYYEDRFDAIIDNKKFYSNFINEIENLTKLNTIILGDLNLNKTLKKQIFIGVITSVETFLSDTFINLTMNDKDFLKNFIETHPEFKNRKIELREIYKAQDNLKNIAKSVMLDMLYHDLPKIKEMYEATFNIKFPLIKDLIKEVSKRHHLVHRGGKTKEGEILEISATDIDNVIGFAKVFVEDIAEKLNLKEMDSMLDF